MVIGSRQLITVSTLLSKFFGPCKCQHIFPTYLIYWYFILHSCHFLLPKRLFFKFQLLVLKLQLLANPQGPFQNQVLLGFERVWAEPFISGPIVHFYTVSNTPSSWLYTMACKCGANFLTSLSWFKTCILYCRSLDLPATSKFNTRSMYYHVGLLAHTLLLPISSSFGFVLWNDCLHANWLLWICCWNSWAWYVFSSIWNPRWLLSSFYSSQRIIMSNFIIF